MEIVSSLTNKLTMSILGIRVVRGPDWKWFNQDIGEGNLGTVCKVVPDISNVVMVKWDSGNCNSYCIGYNNLYELRIFDNSYIGVNHMVECKGCYSKTILGLRYQCTECDCYDLCHKCYHGNMHSKGCEFMLYPTDTTVGIKLPPRICATKVKSPSGSTYYCDHLPILGMLYEQTEKTECKIIAEQLQTIEMTNKCICCEKPSSENVTFHPCKHKIACIDCSKNYKKCVLCENVIRKRINVDGCDIPNAEENRMRELEDQLNNMEELHFCAICFENVANILFMCGHKACAPCVRQLESCHMCRERIDKIIRI